MVAVRKVASLRSPFPAVAGGAARRRLAVACGFLPALVLAFGCGGPSQPRETEHIEVSGKVLFKGKPLPGGRVTFVADKGGFSSTAQIGADGTYQIKAPVGPVKISVETEQLRDQRQPTPEEAEMRKKTGAAAPTPGVYVPIPAKYADASKSGLTYTVVSGPQTHDITLE